MVVEVRKDNGRKYSTRPVVKTAQLLIIAKRATGFSSSNHAVFNYSNCSFRLVFGFVFVLFFCTLCVSASHVSFKISVF